MRTRLATTRAGLRHPLASSALLPTPLYLVPTSCFCVRLKRGVRRPFPVPSGALETTGPLHEPEGQCPRQTHRLAHEPLWVLALARPLLVVAFPPPAHSRRSTFRRSPKHSPAPLARSPKHPSASLVRSHCRSSQPPPPLLRSFPLVFHASPPAFSSFGFFQRTPFLPSSTRLLLLPPLPLSLARTRLLLRALPIRTSLGASRALAPDELFADGAPAARPPSRSSLQRHFRVFFAPARRTSLSPAPSRGAPRFLSARPPFFSLFLASSPTTTPLPPSRRILNPTLFGILSAPFLLLPLPPLSPRTVASVGFPHPRATPWLRSVPRTLFLRFLTALPLRSAPLSLLPLLPPPAFPCPTTSSPMPAAIGAPSQRSLRYRAKPCAALTPSHAPRFPTPPPSARDGLHVLAPAPVRAGRPALFSPSFPFSLVDVSRGPRFVRSWALPPHPPFRILSLFSPLRRGQSHERPRKTCHAPRLSSADVAQRCRFPEDSRPRGVAQRRVP